MEPIHDSSTRDSEPYGAIEVKAFDFTTTTTATLPRRDGVRTRLCKARAVRRLLAFLLRIDVCWTVVFFLFLTSVALLTTWITQAKVLKALHESWDDVFNSRLAIINWRLNLVSRTALDMTRGYESLQGETPIPYGNESALAKLCSILVSYDTHRIINTFTASSYAQLEAVTCMHGIGLGVAMGQLVGYVSTNHTVNASYFIDDETYRFVRPLKAALVWPEGMRNISTVIQRVVETTPIFDNVSAKYNGLKDVILDPRSAWKPADNAPHLIALNMPFGLLLNHLPLPSGSSPYDYVQVRINGTHLLATNGTTYDQQVSMAIFINASLTDKDPLIMANSWKQQSLYNEEIYVPMVTSSASYLRVSAVSSPLMREAFKHVDFAALQRYGYNKTVDFHFRGAPATVHARMYTTRSGFSIPLVYASASADITGGYDRTMDIVTGVLATVVVLFTALFWYFAHTAFAVPLARMTERLLASLWSGKRHLYDDAKGCGVHLSEVRQLVEAHNGMMRRLRNIDQFIPENVRKQQQQQQQEQQAREEKEEVFTPLNEWSALPHLGGAEEMAERPAPALRSQMLSVVYVTMRVAAESSGATAGASTTVTAASRRSSMPPVSTANAAGRPPHLVEVVESAAHAIAAVHSGPFPCPDALSAFATAVHSLSHKCRGVVHQLTPESCTVHFGAAVEALYNSCLAGAAVPMWVSSSAAANATASSPASTSEQLEYEQCARCDARNAVAFALALQAWVEEANNDEAALWFSSPSFAAATYMPDVRVLVDTGMFTCGRYRAQGSEQTLAVAFGRDVQRYVGHVPARIGVKVAMTAETACRVRAKRNAAVGSCGTRQIPVEALCIGRAGLDADVVLLFEALPGPVAGDAAWRCYSRHCFDGFSLMLRGDYAGALRVFRAVAEIGDLEPGLLPPSLAREAAASSAVGGAVSVQVARLIRECERRVRAHNTHSFCRGRNVPLGVDAVLKGQLMVSEADPNDSVTSRSLICKSDPPRTPSRRATGQLAAMEPLAARRVVSLSTCRGVVKSVVPVHIHQVKDNCGLFWRVGRRQTFLNANDLWQHRFLVLGSAGAVASLRLMVLRDVPLAVQHAIRDLPLGLLDKTADLPIPVTRPTPQQRRLVRAIYQETQQLKHPNLIAPIGYSFSVEGTVAVIKEYCRGGTLQEVIDRYSELRPITVARFSWYLSSALSYLHKRGIVHGLLFPRNISVTADGRCRLHSQTPYFSVAEQLLAIPRCIYVSPAMAAGAAPTPACDMYCYGLLALAMLSRGKVWKWAPTADGQPQRSDEELQSMLKAVEQPFFDAVTERRLVPDTDVLDGPVMMLNENRQRASALLRRLLSPDPAQRPLAHEVHQLNRHLLTSNGLKVDDEAY